MADEPILDLQAINELREMLGDDIAELFGEYLIDSSRLLDEMEQAAAQRDISLLTPLAHTLKGSSGNLGVVSIYNLAKELEEAGRSGSVTDPAAAVRQLKEAFTAAQGALTELAGAS